MRFARLDPVPDLAGVIVYLDVAWPFLSIVQARRTAKECGLPGFWRVKR